MHLIQRNNNNGDNNNDHNHDDNNNSFFVIYLFIFFCILFCYLFGTICLLQNGVPTKACIIYFSITRGSDSKIWKIYLSTMKQKNKKTNKYSDSLGMAHQLMTGETVSGIPVKTFLLWFPSRSDYIQPCTTVIIFVCLSLFCFLDGYVTTSRF